MTQPHSDDNQTSWTAPHGDAAGERLPPTAQPSDGGVYAGWMDAPLPPGGLPLLDSKYLATERCAGGMGVVYKCIKRTTGQIVALKTVLSDGPMSVGEIKSMRHNYDRVHKLSHDHIVRLNALEVDERNGQWYVEMDWVEGESLKDHLRQFGGDVRGTAKETVRVLRQVAEALDYAHGRGIVHRDVKDANIMIEKATGNVVLIDFGIASRASHQVSQNGTVAHDVTATTTASVFAGTRGYQSPEQWRGERAEASSDEYSLAVTAYRCLSGHLPFWSDNTGMLQEMVLNDDAPPVKSLPDEANAVLKKGLAKKPSERYGTCRAFIDALGKGLSSMTAAEPTASTMKDAADAKKDESFSMAEFYILSGEMDEKFTECGKREWDRGQTFGIHLDAFNKACRGAKGAVGIKDFAFAYKFYKQAEGEWKWLEANEPLRTAAAASREKAMVSQKTAVEAEAGRLAAGKLQEATEHLKTADGDFESGRFREAENGYAVAESAFAKAAEMARIAKRIMDLEKSIKKAIDEKRFQEARKSVGELKKLDSVKAETYEVTIETAECREKTMVERKVAEKAEAGRLAAEKQQEAAELLKTADGDFESGRFREAEKKYAAAANAFAKAAEMARLAKRIMDLEKSIKKAIDEKRYQNARQFVDELKELDSAKAALWDGEIERLGKADRIDELETTIHNHIQNKCFDKAQKDLEELEKLDAMKAASLEMTIYATEANWRAESIEELERAISTAINDKRFQDANKAVEELRKLDAVKGASWETAADEASKADRIGALEESIPRAIDEKRFQDARKDIDELKGLDAAEAASWEATAKRAETANARKTMMTRTIGVAVSVAGIIFTSVAVITLLTVLFMLFRQHPLEEAHKESETKVTANPSVTEPAGKGIEYKTINLPGGVKLKMVKVEKGGFRMGSNDGDSDEKPVHKVMLTTDFWIGETEITQSQYVVVMGKNPSSFKKGGDHPVESVSWYDAMAFCLKLTERERSAGRLPSGYEFSLPTEAQWEYAARGGGKSKGYEYSGSDNLDKVGWYDYNSGGSTHPETAVRTTTKAGWYDYNSGGSTHSVRQKKPNELGLYDMSGNVWEWCRDRYGGYPNSEVTNPVGPSDGSYRVLRGGSWNYYAGFCRSANRNFIDPSDSGSIVGFRLALAPVQ
ncbi:MAG: SUMF1/EgtB/PvdO family nonheme iron enzyme [Victivallales bacterium]|nr:SUMF1/EgtB/PvdO family nonheme iron enzyme [Victivallales bacterium]